MKIYIASSVKNEKEVLDLAKVLRDHGHQVDAFCEERPGRKVFRESDIKDIEKYDAKEFLKLPEVRKGFREDKKWIDWSDCIVQLLPCGKSASLELGYGVGSGKLGFIFGKLEPNKVDVMEAFSHGIFGENELDLLLERLSDFDTCKLCRKKFNSFNKLLRHVSKSHNLKHKQYCDQYLHNKQCYRCKEFKEFSAFYVDHGREAYFGKCKLCASEIIEEFKKQNPLTYRLQTKKAQRRLVKEIIDHYGGKCACPSCGETELEFLVIDHINGGGNKHRAEIGGLGGAGFYRWIKRNNFPEGFQVLCHNCNWSKGSGKLCVHERESKYAILAEEDSKLNKEKDA